MPLIGWFMWTGHLCIVLAGISLVSTVKSALGLDGSSWSEPPLTLIVYSSFCLLAVSVGFAWSARNCAWACHATRYWSHCAATIIKSERKIELLTFLPPVSVTIEFEFEANGWSYTSNRVHFCMAFWVQLTEILDRYPVGTKVCVFYDPSDPNRNCLEKTTNLAEIIFLIHFAAFVAGIPIGLIV